MPKLRPLNLSPLTMFRAAFRVIHLNSWSHVPQESSGSLSLSPAAVFTSSPRTRLAVSSCSSAHCLSKLNAQFNF